MARQPIAAAIALFMSVAAMPAWASSSGGNCVAYARELTGIRLDGNAAMWWPHAAGRYGRGQQPAVGAVLVFRPSRTMHVGHLAVVSRIVGPREILVDQANWVRGRVTKAISVVDASPQNDWTSVKVQYSGTHGRENPTFGFVYPQPAAAGTAIAMITAASPAAPKPPARHPAHHVARFADNARHPPPGSAPRGEPPRR